MKIMITGGGGFIGSHLADRYLEENNEIILLIRNKSKTENIAHILKKVKIEIVDITDFKKLGDCIDNNEPDLLVHLAGETSHAKSFEKPLYDIDVNAKSTLFLLEKIRKSKLDCRFILGSTFIVIGRPSKLPVTEETPCNPTTLYGINRLASENYCKVYNEVYGLDTIIFRITNSFGPREQFIPNKNAVNYLIYKAFKGEEITIYDKGKFFRDIIYIKDVIEGIKTISEKGKSGNLYWISSGNKTWFYEFGKLLEDLTSAKIKYIESPTYTKKVDVGNFLVDNTKLKSLGWSQNYSLKDGIKETLEFFKSL